jgi:GntR family transcriptional regulator/MocR family aminotransferase
VVTVSRNTRRGGHVPLLPIDARSRVPLYEQIYQALRDRILRGELRGGARLASTRTIAAELSVSRFTVVGAVDRLLAEGYLTARRGSGTFVAEPLPEQTMRPERGREAAGRIPASERSRAAGGNGPRLSTRGNVLSAIVITGPRQEDGPRPFHPRRPALDIFPVRLWARLIARQWRSATIRDMDYGEPAGHPLLRKAIAEHIGVSRGLRCDPRQVIVTSGAQQAFDMLFRLLLDPGDAAWIEEPGYLDVRAALVGAGARLVPVPIDDYGIDVQAGIARAPDARLAVVSPSHQYPSGRTLAAPRRAALLEWARRAGSWIVEDDYDSYFRYRGRPIPALQRFDDDTAQRHQPRVIYVGTFSKTMFPALRLGFCVVPDTLVEAAANARAVASRNSPIADQAALAAFILDGHYDRHLRRARLVYQERYEAICAACDRDLGGVLTLTAASAGTHVLAWFNPGTRRDGVSTAYAPRVSRAAVEDGLVVFPLSRYCVDPPQRDGFVLGYGAITPRQIAAGSARLARVIARLPA